MKRLVCVILVLVMCLSLVACGGNKDDIRDALQGSWVATWTANGQTLSRYYTFKGDKYTTGGVAVFGEVATETGTYQIKGSSIVLTPDDGSNKSELDYTYNKNAGTIILWWNDDVQFEKGRVSISY